jgi:hypothetical protein
MTSSPHICDECKVDLSQVDEHDEGCSTGALEHCYHRAQTYDERDELHDPAEDYCVHCECCCTCLGCEYGPQDGLVAAESATPEQAAGLAEMREEVR